MSSARQAPRPRLAIVYSQRDAARLVRAQRPHEPRGRRGGALGARAEPLHRARERALGDHGDGHAVDAGLASERALQRLARGDATAAGLEAPRYLGELLGDHDHPGPAVPDERRFLPREGGELARGERLVAERRLPREIERLVEAEPGAARDDAGGAGSAAPTRMRRRRRRCPEARSSPGTTTPNPASPSAGAACARKAHASADRGPRAPAARLAEGPGDRREEPRRGGRARRGGPSSASRERAPEPLSVRPLVFHASAAGTSRLRIVGRLQQEAENEAAVALGQLQPEAGAQRVAGAERGPDPCVEIGHERALGEPFRGEARRGPVRASTSRRSHGACSRARRARGAIRGAAARERVGRGVQEGAQQGLGGPDLRGAGRLGAPAALVSGGGLRARRHRVRGRRHGPGERRDARGVLRGGERHRPAGLRAPPAAPAGTTRGTTRSRTTRSSASLLARLHAATDGGARPRSSWAMRASTDRPSRSAAASPVFLTARPASETTTASAGVVAPSDRAASRSTAVSSQRKKRRSPGRKTSGIDAQIHCTAGDGEKGASRVVRQKSDGPDGSAPAESRV